jgi:hypothetical protein
MVSKITCRSINYNENLTKFNSLNLTGIRIEDNTNNLELSIPGEPSLELSENRTYTLQLQNRSSIIPILNNNASNNVKNMDTQYNTQGDVGSNDIQNEDDMDKDEDVNSESSNSINEDGVKEGDFLQETHDRVIDQVTEQLRESGIDFRPGVS